ncbi:MAG TPA: lysoplasmalogenase, partial [Acidimicrobiales bacterium]|nr:lysoplasmalogenase [Acidimicrobiales bacterium]
LEYLCKPAVVVLLIGLALALDPRDPSARTWFVVALVCSLAGDVFLMVPRDLFVFGLGAFLLAHLAYVVGLAGDGVAIAWLLAGVVLVAVGILVLGTQIVRAAYAAESEMAIPVMVYIGVISAMVVAAVGTGRPLAIGGALLFYSSDALIGWSRFVRECSWAPVVIMVTYHLGQLGLVLSLI